MDAGFGFTSDGAGTTSGFRTPLAVESTAPDRYFNNLEKDTIMRRHYGIINFIFDVFMTIITSGLWLIWIFVREMRRR